MLEVQNAPLLVPGEFGDLVAGDTFYHSNSLWIKLQSCDPNAAALDGSTYTFYSDEYVMQVFGKVVLTDWSNDDAVE